MVIKPLQTHVSICIMYFTFICIAFSFVFVFKIHVFNIDMYLLFTSDLLLYTPYISQTDIFAI